MVSMCLPLLAMSKLSIVAIIAVVVVVATECRQEKTLNTKVPRSEDEQKNKDHEKQDLYTQ